MDLNGEDKYQMNKLRQALIDEACIEDTDTLVFLEGLRMDEAIIGICYQEGPEYQPPRIAYDIEKIINIFQSQGMNREEAEEFYSYNTVRAIPYMGKTAPVLIQRIEQGQYEKRKSIYSKHEGSSCTTCKSKSKK